MNCRLLSAVTAAVVLCVSHPAYAQVLYGSLVGSVSDPSGSVVPKAVVRVTHEETGQTRTAETNDSGGAAYEQDFRWFLAWIAWQRNSRAD